jgi:hypothetical protein
MPLPGLAEAVKNLRLVDYFAKGQRAYMLGIEKRDNPENSPSSRTLWERGWEARRESFAAMNQRGKV